MWPLTKKSQSHVADYDEAKKKSIIDIDVKTAAATAASSPIDYRSSANRFESDFFVAFSASLQCSSSELWMELFLGIQWTQEECWKKTICSGNDELYLLRTLHFRINDQGRFDFFKSKYTLVGRY